MRPTTRLRELINAKETLIVPGCYNAMTAKIIEQTGFPAVYMTGYGTSLALLGMPDAGLATMTEMHLNARYIANAVKIPLIADCDNGYGNAINVDRAVREYIQTGTAARVSRAARIASRLGRIIKMVSKTTKEAGSSIIDANEKANGGSNSIDDKETANK